MAWQLPHASGVPGLLVRVCRARLLDVIMLKSAEFVEVVEVDFETLPAVLDPPCNHSFDSPQLEASDSGVR